MKARKSKIYFPFLIAVSKPNMDDTRNTMELFEMPQIQQTNQKDQRVRSVGALRRHNGRD